jgi:hypothetical protein
VFEGKVDCTGYKYGLCKITHYIEKTINNNMKKECTFVCEHKNNLWNGKAIGVEYDYDS